MELLHDSGLVRSVDIVELKSVPRRARPPPRALPSN